ncbi:MAG: META domain-containing protein [Sporichthyaceae bacterium]
MKPIGALALTLLLAGCGGSTTVVAAGDGDAAGGTPAIGEGRPSGEWRTSSIEQAPSTTVPGAKPDAFTLRFFDDGRVLAQARCNSLQGQYRIEGGRFVVQDLAQTEMGCPGDNRQEEDQWLGAFLTASPTYVFDGTTLGLTSDAIDVVLKPREEVQPNATLIGTRWELTHLTDGPAPGAPADPNSTASASMPPVPMEFTLTTLKVSGTSGCARFSGPAEVTGENVRFGRIDVDTSACGPDALAQLPALMREGVLAAKVHLRTLTLTHSSGKGMQLSAAQDAPAAGPGPATVEPPMRVDDGAASDSEPVAQRPVGEWRTTTVEENTAPRTGSGIAPSEFTLSFFDGDRVSANARCNSVGGSYDVVDGRFVMDEAAQTKKGCPGDRQAEDQWLVSFLTAKPSFAYDGKRIAMTTAMSSVVLEPAS